MDKVVAEVCANMIGTVYGAMQLDDDQMRVLGRICTGMSGLYWALQSAQGDNVKAPELLGEKAPEMKTRIEDCWACWCDDCEIIEACTRHLDGVTPDGIAPAPCVSCKDGMRFKPKPLEPQCGYQQGSGRNHG